MKYGSQIRTIRGCTKQLENVAKELDFYHAVKGYIKGLKDGLEIKAKEVYDKASNKLS